MAVGGLLVGWFYNMLNCTTTGQTGKGYKHTKLYLGSLAQKFICCYIFYLVFGEKQSMKGELTALVWQKETCHEERKKADTNFKFSGFSLLF